ncbi:uncharacterized protein LOC141909143 [Tubulanus polymorphus]|uniref:uncharacterized protein LOC141909143 n=1 Tax=Tubulanus polymorphus TaxID=672921 RepID=UPI003DA6574E
MVTKPRFEISALQKVSTLNRLIRLAAMVLRFVKNSQARVRNKKEQIQTGEVTAAELKCAKSTIVKLSQTEVRNRKYEVEFRKLSPFVDSAGIIRVGGRLGNADVAYDQKHRVLLPKDHFISKLIVEHQHRCGHPGVAATTAKVRRGFWIIGLNRLAKSVVRSCLFCREMCAKVEDQHMADLPSIRLNPSPPFQHTACDLFGPFNVRIKRMTTMKVWGVIFTCLATRAVYCDIALDTQHRNLFKPFDVFYL